MSTARHGLTLTKLSAHRPGDPAVWRVVGTQVLLFSDRGGFTLRRWRIGDWQPTDAWLERHGLTRAADGSMLRFRRRTLALDALAAAIAIEPAPDFEEARPVAVVRSDSGYRSRCGRFAFERADGHAGWWLVVVLDRNVSFPSLIAARRYASTLLQEEGW